MDKEKIQEIIEKNKSVALTLKENPDEPEILSREGLRLFFQNKGLSVYLWPEIPENLKSKWSPILTNHSNPPFFNEVFLRFPKSSFDIKEVNYEENSDFLTLKLLAGESEIEKEKIIFESRPTTIDSLVFLSSSEIEELPDFGEKISFPDEEKIILITPEEKTLAEKTFEIIELGGAETIIRENNLSNLLLATLLLETNNFKKKVNENSLNLAHHLFSLGADKKFIDEILNKEFSLSFAQILGRTLARTRLNEPLQSNWAFISSQDFTKAGIKNQDVLMVRRLVNKINELVPSQPIFITLWEDNERKVWSLMTHETESSSSGIFEKLSNHLGPGRKEDFIVTGPYKSFSEAEIKIKQILKEIV